MAKERAGASSAPPASEDNSVDGRSRQLAQWLLEQAVLAEQVAYRLRSDDDVALIRGQVRALARRRAVRIRTGVVQGALVVVRADASVWTESAAQMRTKLTPDAGIRPAGQDD